MPYQACAYLYGISFPSFIKPLIIFYTGYFTTLPIIRNTVRSGIGTDTPQAALRTYWRFAAGVLAMSDKKGMVLSGIYQKNNLEEVIELKGNP